MLQPRGTARWKTSAELPLPSRDKAGQSLCQPPCAGARGWHKWVPVWDNRLTLGIIFTVTDTRAARCTKDGLARELFSLHTCAERLLAAPAKPLLTETFLLFLSLY